MKQFISLFVLFTILSPMILVAETRLDNWERVMALKRGTEVSLQTMDGKILSGSIGESWRNGLSLFTDPMHVVRISGDDVRRIWKLRKRDIRLPVLIGIGIGGTAGYAIGKIAETDADRAEDPGLLPLIGAFTGVLIGATTGLLTGFSSNHPKDKIIYQNASD